MKRSGARRPLLTVPSTLTSRGSASLSTASSNGSTRCGPGPTGAATSYCSKCQAARLQRRQRRELEAAIERLEQTLPKMSRQQRDGTVQMAMDGMTLLRV